MKRAALALLLSACTLLAAAATAAHGDADVELNRRLAALATADASADAGARWQALMALARQLRGRPEPSAAALATYFGKQALRSIDARSAAGFAPAAPDAEALDAVREVAGWLALDGRYDEALQTLQVLKEAEFLGFVQHQPGWADAAVQTTFSDAESRFGEPWRQLPAPARARSGAAVVDADLDAAWVGAARAALLAMAERAAPPPGAATARAPLRPAPAADETLHVHAVAQPTHLLLLFTTPGWAQVRQIAWPRAEAQREIGSLLAALGRGEAALPALQALYQRFGVQLDGAARSRGARRIVVQSDGALRYLPLAALHDGQAYLSERYVFVQQARALDAGMRAAPSGPPLLQAVGVSQPHPGQPALPGVAREVCAIVAGPVHGLAGGDAACAAGGGRGVVPGEGWLNEQFTSRRFAEAAGRGGSGAQGGAMLHVGTHFDLRPGTMARSSLLLGDGTRLALDSIARLDFRGHDLITLSACETGIGGVEGGAEIDGLNLLLVRRGARAVLASLWRVDDFSTSALMAAFYSALRGADPALALQRAQAEVRSTPGWQSPFHWAGFYLTTRP